MGTTTTSSPSVQTCEDCESLTRQVPSKQGVQEGESQTPSPLVEVIYTPPQFQFPQEQLAIVTQPEVHKFSYILLLFNCSPFLY